MEKSLIKIIEKSTAMYVNHLDSEEVKLLAAEIITGLESHYTHLPLNLQQGLIFEGTDERTINKTVAIYDKNSNVVVYYASTKVITPRLQRKLEAIMPDFKKATITFGDSFRIDTWDGKISKRAEL